jgi:spore coat protein SA
MGGSVEICIKHIAAQLSARHKVTVVSRQHRRYPARQTEGNLTIVRVPTGSPSRYIANAIEAVRGNHFDVIQIDNRPKFVPAVRNAFPHTPISLFLHSLTFVSAPMIGREQARACLAQADLIVTNSKATSSTLKRRFASSRHKIRTVWLGVNLKLFRPRSAELRRSIKRRYRVGKGFTLLFTGRIIPRKGIPVLLKAAAIMRRQVPGVNVAIAGNGKKGYLGQLKRQARRLGVNARFIGYIPHRRIHEIYGLADCFVCPSQRHESFGLVNVEALASGVPVVSSRNGGIKEIVRHGKNGFLVGNYRSPRAFARYLVRIARDRALRMRLSKQARSDAVKRFSWRATAGRLSGLYLKASKS